ncbi:NADH:flavorubredoxin reductase NorW [Methylophaga sp. OBS4]|uniref:NADH:flavorubredoxin reductase NorW n=1 Tax=Methylophaga sp. OBS4 TaxID=2991935 RepID=UPI002254B3E9|nr:NADH:flavorubredoxin reductase NorW [Methylophaga sp. OBS4]MCX4186874.1 NADH:flavorubredoxin reductase NorW [Methylophaga sp. OBS4]
MMNNPIIIIGSGFAAYQLIKTIRRSDQECSILVFTADEGHEYNKPDLSHVFSKRQRPEDLFLSTGADFAEKHNITLYANHTVEDINREDKTITANGQGYAYSKLVIATGARAFIPPIDGDAVDRIYTLNSLSEFAHCRENIQQAKRVMMIGGGLVGIEIAMDLSSSNKQVCVVECSDYLMKNLLPEYVAIHLKQQFEQDNAKIYTNTTVNSVEHHGEALRVTFNSGEQIEIDAIICAAGLIPNNALAKAAGLKVNRGIVVNEQLQTSDPDIFSIGDCAEFEGQVRAFLQPIVLSANSLAKTLLGEGSQLILPNMMVKVKTPRFPIQVGGITGGEHVSRWTMDIDDTGMVAQSFNLQGQLIGFVATREKTAQAFSLLRELD